MLRRHLDSHIESYSPLLARCLTKRSIEAGASKALSRAEVTLQQTDIKPLVTELHKPVLILASPRDTVAPFDYFLSFENPAITLAKIDDRTHPGMAVISQLDGELIRQWLVTLSSLE